MRVVMPLDLYAHIAVLAITENCSRSDIVVKQLSEVNDVKPLPQNTAG